jgi:hypothetical protein
MNHLSVVDDFSRQLNGECIKESELNKLHDEIIQLFNNCIININRCESVAERTTKWGEANKIYEDFQLKCVNADELNAVKRLLKKVLDSCS